MENLFTIARNTHYNPKSIVENVIKRAGKGTKNIPVFKYLREMGIADEKTYNQAGLDLNKWVKRDLKDFRVKAYQQGFFKFRHLSMGELIKASTAQNASGYIPCLAKDKIDVELLRQFLLENEQKLYTRGPYQSNFRKLATLYDKLRWGW